MKKGFTLIELLAVIVILAIIALIAIPQITNVVENAKKEAGARSVEGHVESINTELAKKMLLGSDLSDGEYSFSSLNIKTKGNVTCTSYTLKSNTVLTASNCVANGYTYNYDMNSGAHIIDANSSSLDTLVYNRVNNIRTTSNTDISKRTGKIYYVSAEGNDSNDGLSPEYPFKTSSKVEEMFKNNQIADHSTILFRDGDRFTTQFNINANDILLGSYGNIKKGKPTLTRSNQDINKNGKWVEVKKNIWKFTYNNSDKIFKYDVGSIEFFCNDNNKSCRYSMNTLNKKYDYAYKITTNNNYDDSNIESKIDTLLKNDLEFYHAGHAYNSTTTGESLYLYSKENPSTRFDQIEISEGGNVISTYLTHKTNLLIDNISVMYGGSHGVLTSTISNISVTNSEFAFIGGSVHNYNSGNAERYGNAIQVKSVDDIGGYPVTIGFYAYNNYIYQCFDTGLTFQFTGKETGNDSNRYSKMRKAIFKHNVLEYNNWNIEYWTYTLSNEQTYLDNTYIEDFLIEDNILRYPGKGISDTRPGHGYSAHIKTWNHNSICFNIVKNSFIIKDNIFDEADEQYIYIKTGGKDLPILINNKFYGRDDLLFGYYSNTYQLNGVLSFDDNLLNEKFSGNTFIVKDKKIYSDASGKTGDVNWNFDSSNHTLTISGTGNMSDYTSSKSVPWNKYSNSIYNIVIGENVSKLGKYAFADLKRVKSIRIDSVKLSDLSSVNTNTGDNYTFYNTGSNYDGITITFGSKVTYIPKMLFQPTGDRADSPNITKIIFMGNKISKINTFGLSNFKGDTLSLPEGVKELGAVSVSHSKSLKVLVLPNSLTTISDWSMQTHYELEKVLFGLTTNKIEGNVLKNAQKLKLVVIPHISSPDIFDKNTFSYSSNNITVYGDDSVETWVNNIKLASGQVNLIYKPLSEYRPTVKSNTSISGSVSYNGSFTFTSNGTISAYTYYIDSDGRFCKIDDNVDLIKNGNLYTINNIRNDIYIEIK